jgi:hypothetical protein
VRQLHANLSAGYHPRPAGRHVTGLHDHLVKLIGALTIDDSLYRTLLNFPYTAGRL